MRMLSEPAAAAPVDCPYLPDRTFVQIYFFATDLDEYEYEVLLASGWRRFGTFFFQPSCPGCRQCIPIRVDVNRLQPTRSQRRVLGRGREIVLDAAPTDCRDEVWEVYRAHSRSQFAREVNRADFETTFFEDAVPALQTEYRLDGRLVGLGFLDVGIEGFSSVYFSFHPEASSYSLGTLSVLRESELARLNGKKWYYLGYWVPGCDTMEYKAKFRPFQLLDWDTGEWRDSEEFRPAENRAPAAADEEES